MLFLFLVVSTQTNSRFIAPISTQTFYFHFVLVPHNNTTMRSFFWILLALTVSTALGQITFEMNAKGLTSLMYGGRNWIGKYERETYIYENNTIISRVLSKTLYSPNEARWAYSWGSINLQVAVDNATSTAYLTLVVNNTLGSLVLTSIRGDLATISYPTNIAQYDGNNVLLNTNIGGKQII
jgi:hypothetical protein